MVAVAETSVHDALLCQSLITACWHDSDIGESAALDQIRAYLAEDPTRAARLTNLAVLFCASMMRPVGRAIATHMGHKALTKWEIQRTEGGQRADTEAYAVVGDALEDELNLPGSALPLISAWLTDADVDAGLRLVREALWIAAEIGIQTL